MNRMIPLDPETSENLQEISTIFGQAATERLIADFQSRCVNTSRLALHEHHLLPMPETEATLDFITDVAILDISIHVKNVLQVARRYSERPEDAFKMITTVNATQAASIAMKVLRLKRGEKI